MKLNRIALAVALAGLSVGAHATNGYFSHGYGMKAKGRAGASTAMADDAMGGAVNPAKMVFVGNRLDLGVDLFNPNREMSRTGDITGSVESDSEYFLVPEFGYNKMIKPNLSLGVTVYGNGGMNTDYPGGGFDCGGGPVNNALCGVGSLGVDLMQLIIAPTLAYKLNESHAIGISPLLGYQRFKANGLQAFAGMSSDAANLTNRDYDDAFGYGVRVGYMGKLSDRVTVGAAYASKMEMDEFDDYKGLFAEQGDFDIPANWNLGVAFQATPQIMLTLDYQRIQYSDVNSIANPSANALIGAQLGAGNGPGFGWDDVDVWKLGVEYAYSKNLTLRAGWNHGDNPIRSQDVTFNILAPGVIQDHLTLGFTYTTPSGGEWTAYYMHALEEDVTGSSLFTAMGMAGPATEKIKMDQNSLGVAYSWKF